MEVLTSRRATASDLVAIVALLADDVLGRSRENPGPPLDPCYADAFAAIERDPNQFLAVAEEGGAIVACLQLSFIPGLSRRGLWRGQIESVRVAATRRGGGIGRRVFEWAIEECRRRDGALVPLTKLGRASGRERVCEYGYISVDA